MFLRQPAQDDARAVRRSPDVRDDRTGLTSVPPRVNTRQFTPTTYDSRAVATYGSRAVATGQLQCLGAVTVTPAPGSVTSAAVSSCAPPGRNRSGRLRCRSRPVRRSGWGWLIALIGLAVLALLLLAGTRVWAYVLS
jgi:hypothetical protein